MLFFNEDTTVLLESYLKKRYPYGITAKEFFEYETECPGCRGRYEFMLGIEQMVQCRRCGTIIQRKGNNLIIKKNTDRASILYKLPELKKDFAFLMIGWSIAICSLGFFLGHFIK